jgi:hypothetical protein
MAIADHIHYTGQRLVFDHDLIQRILRRRFGLADDHSDRLTSK